MESHTYNSLVHRKGELNRLLEVKALIDDTLLDCSEQLHRLKSSKLVTVDDVIKVSMQIRYNTHAPREFKVGFPLVNGHPPAPQPEEMRNSKLVTINQRDQQSDTSTKDKGDGVSGQSFVVQLGLEMAKHRERKLQQNLEQPVDMEVTTDDVSSAALVGDINQQQPVEGIEQGLRDTKKARTANISFASYDDSDSDD